MWLRVDCHTPCGCIVTYLMLEEGAAEICNGSKIFWGTVSFVRYQIFTADGSCIWLENVNGLSVCS